jgi:hypothetical protein
MVWITVCGQCSGQIEDLHANRTYVRMDGRDNKTHALTLTASFFTGPDAIPEFSASLYDAPRGFYGTPRNFATVFESFAQCSAGYLRHSDTSSWLSRPPHSSPTRWMIFRRLPALLRGLFMFTQWFRRTTRDSERRIHKQVIARAWEGVKNWIC